MCFLKHILGLKSVALMFNGADAFVNEGFKSWNKLSTIRDHVVEKDIIHACAKETTKSILEELNDGFFAILVDESADTSDKEQMALCLRYVNQKGEVCEQFIGVVHAPNTTSLTLLVAIESLLMEYSLTFSKVRGQGYYGASNMQGAINGLKTLVQNECPQAYFVHCFAHQLQLTQVAIAKKNSDCGWLFIDLLAPLLNFVGGSSKIKEFLREKQVVRVVEALSLGEIETGSGLNQERGFRRPCDTRWGSHFKTILNVLNLYPTILESLDAIVEVSDTIDSNKAQFIIHLLMSFDFVFVAHLIVSIFGITNDLIVALQKHDQDIVNAMSMVNITKTNLQKMRDKGWDSHMDKVTSFMIKYGVELPNMEGNYIVPGRRLYEAKALRFAAFDKSKLLRPATFYPKEFSSSELLFFDHSLENFIVSIREDERFWNLESLGELLVKLVETGNHTTHESVYLKLKLVLILPVATTSVERVFSGMTQVKAKLQNCMGDQMLNDCLITYQERDLVLNVR
ncbi:uncharacterized protein LOC108219344 [Daucus carota subsp. sativus]|uniref:uncharacterized protein LOC108219344 n=1 Tax=Daucus carota subsp. sativus TaxID=79200 RepID=UPI003082A769